MMRGFLTLVKHALTGMMVMVSVPDQADCMVQATKLSQACDTTALLPKAGRWEGDVGSEKNVCLLLHLDRGQFARVRVEKRRGLSWSGPGRAVAAVAAPLNTSFSTRL